MHPRALIVGGLVWVLSAGAVVRAQDDAGKGLSAEEISRIHEEIRQLRAEVAQLRSEVARASVRGAHSPGAAENPPAEFAAGVGVQSSQAPRLEDSVAMVQAQVAELAQTRVESGSKLPVKLFGTIHSGTFANSGEANWLENPNLVAPPPPPDAPSGSFNSTLRQSRIGVSVDGLDLGAVRASGLVAFDFLGGVPAFQTGTLMGLPRLLYGFIRLERGRTALHVGQDEMVLAPRDPTSLAALSFPLLFRSGNLYLRVPQIRVERRAGREGSEFLVRAGIAAPAAGDFATNLYTFAPPAGAGERSRWPAVQARAGWRAAPAGGSTVLEVGISGHYGRERMAARTAESWAGALDVDAALGRLGFGGEVFVGDNLDAFGGGLGQPARSAGGFVEARLAATDRVRLVGGFGMDRLTGASRGQWALGRNSSWFGNATYTFTPELAGSVEYRWLETAPREAVTRTNHHVNWTMAFSF